ncbi:site-specific DNA-methyltransferase [Microbacterium gubbeenense]|uniref:site-specific DNA-methyltransferase n=1 Tax=Microbacterium gubbeenense TaxID=159896 RepID=UPI0003F67A4D|nr:site-specific DNA-methyltransferase [Microbacterium gubbeenense]
MSRLNDLLLRLENNDPALAKDLRREVDALADRRAFGLNFERHVPEAVELPGRPVRRGDKVRVLPPRGSKASAGDDRLWRVIAIAKDDAGTRTASLELLSDESETADALVDDLVVVAEFRDPIYPGLVSTGKVERGGDKPFHSVINAENYHALQTLLFTHRAKVDVIYIDPPYNTGSEGWIYNDKYVADEDLYRHSKWLAFMERRLLLAKELLKSTGVIVVAIGDEEHHRLRLLMDQIFGNDNFISDVVWQGGTKSYTRYVSNGADYMLIYARDEEALVEAEVQWREKKPGLEEALAAAEQIWQEASSPSDAQKSWRAWLKSVGKGKGLDAIARYSSLDETGKPIRTDGSMVAPEPRPNRPRRALTHPRTGKPCAVPSNGWRYSDQEMDRRIADGRVYFGDDETRIPSEIYRLEAMSTRVAESVFTQDRNRASGHLAKILGDRRFPNPKDPSVLSRWIRLTAPSDACVLDFFGGSGSTVEAVMELNKDDNGTRRCVLVTNNEVSAKDARVLRQQGRRPGDAEWNAKGVYEYVSRPRISTVSTGTRDDGSNYSHGLQENVEFFNLTYESPLRVSSNREFAKVAPLLWLRAGSQGRRIEDVSTGWDVAETYGVLVDLNQSEAFVEAVAANDNIRIAYIVTDEDRLFESVVRELPDHVEPVRLYEAYLQNFEIETGRSAL